MNAVSGMLPELAATTSLTYRCTFGHYKQTDWTDVRALSWDDLATLLTQHEVAPKEGTCIVPATFTGARRHEKDACQIAVVLLDSDAGHTLSEICDAIAAQGWAAAVASTHSHRTTRTRAKRGNWDKFRVTVSDPALAPAAFLRGKGYLERVAEGARIAEETEEFVVFEHQPCPKFRIALPLERPWRASRYDSQRSANAAWKERVAALAAALHLQHDQACTDTSRVFYLPRRPADGPPAETAVLQGQPCDIFALPAAERHKAADGPRGRSGGARRRRSPEKIEFTDPDTGEVLDLQAWARHYAPRFELASALQARRPEVFVPRPDEGAKRHLRCVNEGEHTQAGADAATFVVNASQGTHNSFVYHCRHAHCDGQDRLRFLRQMLDQRWLTVADLTDPAFLVDGQPARPVIRFVPGQVAKIVDQAEQALIDAELGLYQRGTFIVRPGTVRVSVAQVREITAQRMIEVGDRTLVEEMTKAAAWEKYDKRSDEWVSIDAPLTVAATYLQRRGKWRLPVLAGLINAPTLRPDGSILSKPGYDPATALLLGTDGVNFPAVPDEPDWEEGREALSVLMRLIETFPFVSDTDRAVALSAMLTSAIRRSLPTAPLHAFTAPTAGSGKSMLVDLASVITTGREAGVIAQGKTEEELEKRLGALLLAGD
ncbi:MAG TPA: hypothetical protein VNZ61_18110, partial [Roseomonas sp.]|nr:hypothetical protein [Roseomonas sp.]